MHEAEILSVVNLVQKLKKKEKEKNGLYNLF